MNPARKGTVATWKAIEKQLQELPFAWFEASNKGGTGNDSFNTLQAGGPSTDDRSAVVLLSPAPQNLADLSVFLGTEGKHATAQNLVCLAMRSAYGRECL